MKYVEIKNNTVAHISKEQPFIPDLSSVGIITIDITNHQQKDEIQPGWTYTDGVFSAPTPLTDAEIKQDFINQITAQLQTEILATVQRYKFWSIESMRTHKLDESSILNTIATKLHAWEQSLINRFFSLETQIINGELSIDNLDFNDEFVVFNESDW